MGLFGKFWDRIAPASKPPQLEGKGAAAIDDYIARRIGRNEPGLALAVLKDGSVAHAAAYGLADVRRGTAVKTNTIFHLASCGKQFTGLGLLMLAEERRLSLDDYVGKYLPGLAGFGPGVTIRRLLHQTSGIRDLYDEVGVRAVLSRCEQPRNEDIVRTYSELGCPMARHGIRPGDAFSYSNSGYELLGSVIERVSGQSYHDFFQSRVFDRLGMNDTFSVPDPRVNSARTAKGYTLAQFGTVAEATPGEFDELVGAGSFYTTVSDLCTHDRALGSNVLVSEASMREALTPGRTNDGRETEYGLGWYVGVLNGMQIAEHQGEWAGFYSYIRRYRDQPLSIFALSNNPRLDLPEIVDATAVTFR
jgi:CubicO group peptidase (beta-lactamase class C family)